MKTKKTYTFARDVFDAIRETVGQRPPESGGMLGGNLKTGRISHFHFDEKGTCNPAAYSPDTETLNALLDEWNREGIRLLGFVHSHPNYIDHPSFGDEQYAKEILAANSELPALLVPIVQSATNGMEFGMKMFVASRKDDGVEIDREPVRVFKSRYPKDGLLLAEPVDDDRLDVGKARSLFDWLSVSKIPTRPQSEMFARVVDAYDLDLMGRCRVIWVGIGGATACVEDLVRAGVRELVLIDPGLVEECNLATQQYYQKDIGLPKVRCLAERLRAINPDVSVRTHVRSLLDIDDRCFERLASEPIFRPTEPGKPIGLAGGLAITVIVGSSDSFEAQARVNRLALQFGWPSVCCQLYDRALAGELTFTHPETTPACHRCILSSRYQAYLKEGYQNAVGSFGSPIVSTERLNSLTNSILLGILHHGTNHPRWGSLLSRIGNRNLVQVRNHPDVEEELGLANFREALAGVKSAQLFYDESIWRPQVPEHSRTGYPRSCPDCGGLGDLSKCKRKFRDTRIMIPE